MTGAYMKVFGEVGKVGVVAMNGTEYLEFIQAMGMDHTDCASVQPISQHRIWECMDGYSPGAADRAIDEVKRKDPGFDLDRASWTNNKSWVEGYKDLLDPLSDLSVAFHKRFDGGKIDENDPVHRETLLYLLLSQTSCFRYWGTGLWTDYGKEIYRRGMEIVGA